MKIHRKSYVKSPQKDLAWFDTWAHKLKHACGRKYHRIVLETALGKTYIWGLNTKDESLDTLVIFPGARTTPHNLGL